MYKDVKKKLLSVALCICMVIGAVQVVPRAKAAYADGGNGTYKVLVGMNGSSDLQTVTVTLASTSTEYSYTNKENKPSISDVQTASGTSIRGEFNSELTIMGDNVNAGTFYGVLSPTSTSQYYADKTDASKIPFTIKKATPQEISANSGSTLNPVLKYAADGKSPDLASVIVTLTNGRTIEYTGKDAISNHFTLSKISTVGKKQPCTVTLADTTNFDGTISTTVLCDMAYDMADSTYATLAKNVYGYTDSDLRGNIAVSFKNADGTTVLENATKDNASNVLSFVFKQNGVEVDEVKNAGTYTVEVTPADGEGRVVSLGTTTTALYTGKFKGTFTVGLKETKVTVKAPDEENPGTWKDMATYLYRRPLSARNNNGEVLPEDLYVTVDDKRLDSKDYDVTFAFPSAPDVPVRPTTAGQYEMTVTPKASTNYSGSATVPYYVYSGFTLTKFRFKGVGGDSNPTSLPYNAKGYEVDDIEVVDESGNTLINGTHYDIEYWYQNSKNKWTQASKYNDENMLSVGNKRIAVRGKNAYAGQFDETSGVYSIAQVDINSASEKPNFKLTFDDSSYDYTGRTITPVYTVTYKSTTDITKFFTPKWRDNIDAGTAELTLTAKSNSPYKGSLSGTFEIDALQLSEARCVDDQGNDEGNYSYTGAAISPRLMVHDYVLKSSDYAITGYKTQAGVDLGTEVPSAPGDYVMSITQTDDNENIVGESEINYSIIARNIEQDTDASFFLEYSTVEWNGGDTTPKVICSGSLKLVEGKDYIVRYENNSAPTATATAIIEGRGNLTGEKRITFTITERSIDNENIKITPTVSGDAPSYQVAFKVYDAGIAVKNHELNKDADYTIESVVYQTEEGYGGLDGSSLSALKLAGEYEITLKGNGKYNGTRTVTVKCGRDITNATLSMGSERLTYNGASQHPTITAVLKGPYEELTLKKSETAGAFSLKYSRTDGDNMLPSNWPVYAGDIIVQAVGNPEKGYYGTSINSAIYHIDPMNITDSINGYRVDLTDDKKAHQVTSANGSISIHYDYTGQPVEPEEAVKKVAGSSIVSAPAVLTRGRDYSIEYTSNSQVVQQCINVRTYTLRVTGKGNFTGVMTTQFTIDAATNGITAEFTEVGTYADKAPTIHILLNGEELLLNTYEQKGDYTFSVTSEPVAPSDPDSVDGKYTYVYTVTGRNNLNGKFKFGCPVERTVLKEPANASDPKSGDTYVSSWDYDELTIYPGEPVKQPKNFRLSYVQADGANRTLTLNTDFVIDKFSAATEPGENSQLTISGTGGFTGTIRCKVPLYTDINRAKFLTHDGKSVGTIYDKAEVPIDTLKEAIANGSLSDLVYFEPIWTATEGARIPTTCYTVETTQTPEIGQELTLTITGNREQWYTGTRTVTIKVTGALNDEITRVEIGKNNTIAWNGEIIQPSDVDSNSTAKVQVWDGTKQLKVGFPTSGSAIDPDWDCTVTFKNNDGVGLATAQITGVNKYSGQITRSFKITYPMSKLTIKLTKDGKTTEYKEGDVPKYTFKTSTSDNKPDVTLYYPGLNGILTPLPNERYYGLTYTGYQKAGDAMISIGTPADADYTGILLGGPLAVNYYLEPIQAVQVNLTIPKPTYTGYQMDAKSIGLELIYDNQPLKDSDYTLKFANATDVGTGTVYITLCGNFSGTLEETFEIQPKSLADDDITASVEDLLYTGDAMKPSPRVIYPSGYKSSLEEGKDYQIKIYKTLSDVPQDEPFSAVGTYVVRIQGLGNYAGEKDIEYRIVERQMTDGVSIIFADTSADCPVYDGVPACIYTGYEHKPGVKVVYNKKTLSEQSDYELKYDNNIDAGTATVTVSGKGSFAGTASISFTIQPKDITSDDIVYLDDETKTFVDGKVFEWKKNVPQRPKVIVRDTSRDKLLEEADRTITYTDDNGDADNPQTNAGEVTIRISGINNYTGTQEFTYYIGEDISKAYTLVNGSRSVTTTYNGLEQAPAENSITVEKGSSALTLVDENGENRYDIAYYKNGFDKANKVERDQIIDAATYYIAVVGVPSKGTYAKTSESNSCAYTIYPRSIAPSYVLVSGYDGSYYYTGQPIEPKAITVEDTDLPVTSDQADPQRRSVKLVSGTDYDISYTNNTSAGKASIIVTGKGNYSGNRVAYFNIVSSNTDGNNTWDGTSEGTGSISNGSTTISAKDIILGYDSTTYNCMMYNGYERIPTVSINGLSNSDFVITASNNIRPGVATLMITGINNYTGTIYKNYTIKADLSTYGTVSTIVDQNYTGYQITPYVTVTCGGNLLTVGNDYTVTYANNTNVGRATVIATAAANSYYVGTANGYFNISNTATGMEITGYASSYTYTGNAITPDVIVTMNGRMLNRGTDYVVNYSNNTNVGTATMTVTGIGSFSGTKTINYVIEAKNIENCITTAVSNYQYTGNTYTPSVTLTDSSTGKTLAAGTDYTITYSNNTNPGTASITVTALSRNYTGSKVISFKITSAAVSGLRVSRIKNNSMKLSWSDQDYADGYQICNANNRVIGTTSNNSYTVKRLTSCTTYRYKVRSYVENADGSVSYGNFSTAVAAQTMLNTPTLKARSTTRGNVTLTWSKVAKASGYEIYYSTEKNGIYTKLKTVSKSSARRYVDSGLASGEKYYYTIRAYRTVNGVKTYSSYNTIKSATVK